MAYFNHAFQKVFIGTEAIDPFVNDGVTNTAGLTTVGRFGFFDPNTWVNVAAAPATCCELILAASSIHQVDKIGPFHGGYSESNKSKKINPKYVSRFYRVDPCTPQNNIVHVGSTPFTAAGAALTFNNLVSNPGAFTPSTTFTNVATSGGTGTGLTVNVVIDGAGSIASIASITVNNPGIGYTIGDTITVLGTALGGASPADDVTFDVLTVTTATADCCHTFLCDQTYYLRLDIKGSPALRFLTRNTYYTADHYTGCCADPTVAPTPVDSTEVFIGWAKLFMASPLIAPFIQIIVFDQTGVPWFQTAALAVAAGYPSTQIWDEYVSPGYVADACAGMTFVGAYVDTQFGDCTFYPTDFFEKEPVHIYASEVDYTGDPCEFTGICVVEECPPRQGNGFGDTVLKELILSESYLQNNFATNNDLRIREITQGYDLTNTISRSAMYTRYYLQHSVPRFNNPTGVFDNDQYLLQVITNGSIAAFETFVETWLDTCSNCPQLEVFDCDSCSSVIGFI